jgi:competence protein ComEC
MAFFERLGAVGFVRGAAVLDLGRAEMRGLPDRAGLWLSRQRAALSQGLRAALPGPEGAFAAAIVTGDRAAIDERDAEALRAANLAHLLAISGLHMGMLCGLVFAVVRLGLAAVPAVALRLSTKKAAALAALLAGAAYLALSGATVATQRAFVMAAVVLVAVLIDRPALTLRALAAAAVIVLLVRPVSLLEVGFQMSFAATIALVAAYETLRMPRAGGPLLSPRSWPLRLSLYALGILATSLIAGVATAPYAAEAFNRAAPWGLAANLAAVPVMGVVIAPMAILSGLLAPLGLAGPTLWAMGAGIGWVLAVAHEVASWPGAVQPVAAAPEGVIAAITLGGLWLAIWRTRLRLLGLAPVAAALLVWSQPADRPELLIAPGARLIGVMGPEGRAIDHPRAQGFVAETWLRRDGDPALQAEAAARPGFLRVPGGLTAALGEGWRLTTRHRRGVEPAALARLCTPRVLLVARHGPPLQGPCRYLGAEDLARSGAVAARVEAGTLVLEAALQGACRPWTASRC